VRTKIFLILIIENLASIHIKYVYLHLVISHGWRAKGDEIGCSNKGMERLIKWMPDVDSVTKFDLSSSAAISPDAIKKVNYLCVCVCVRARVRVLCFQIERRSLKVDRTSAMTEHLP